MTLYNDTPANVSFLASLLGFEPVVAQGWLRNEGQAVPNPTNPLNIKFWGRPAQTGKLGAFATYAHASAGLADAVAMIRELAPAFGYGAILAQHDSGDPFAQAASIEQSSWAEGGYGGGITAWVKAHYSEDVVRFVNSAGYQPPLKLDVPAGTKIVDFSGTAVAILGTATTLTTVGLADDKGGAFVVFISTGKFYGDSKQRPTLLVALVPGGKPHA